MYNTIGGADVSLCHMWLFVKNNTISSCNEKKKINLENLKNSLFFIHANQRSTDSYILFNSYC